MIIYLIINNIKNIMLLVDAVHSDEANELNKASGG